MKQALPKFEHSAPRKPHHALLQHAQPQFGSEVQHAKVDNTAPMTKEKMTFMQPAVGKLLHCAWTVDPTMLHAVNDISLSAAKGTEATLDGTMHSLNCAHSDPNTKVICRAGDTILFMGSDAAHLVAPEAQSHAGGCQHLSNKEGTLFNGPVLILANAIKNVTASATEAELGALFVNAQEAVAPRNCLDAMGHPQPAAPLKTDDNAANGTLNNAMKQKRSKAIDVRFHWLCDQAQQG